MMRVGQGRAAVEAAPRGGQLGCRWRVARVGSFRVPPSAAGEVLDRISIEDLDDLDVPPRTDPLHGRQHRMDPLRGSRRNRNSESLLASHVLTLWIWAGPPLLGEFWPCRIPTG